MSVPKEKRTKSAAEYVNVANQIYVETVSFLTRLSARYSRLVAEPVAKLAGEVIRWAEAMGLIDNRNKSKIVDISKPFRFCKAKFQLTDTGRVITHGCRDGMKRARRKMRYFKTQVDAEKMTVQQVEQWLQGQIAHYENFDDHGRVLRLRRLFHAIFIGGANHV